MELVRGEEMKRIIAKLQSFYNDTDGNGTSFQNMLRATADFRDHELTVILDELYDMERYYDELERENMELRRQLKRSVRIPA